MTTTVSSTGTPTGQRSIYSTGAGNKKYTSVNVANDAPVYSYALPKHNLNTYGIKDQAGDEWYLTTGGQWRNVKTSAVQRNMPTYAVPAASAPAPAPTPAAAPAPAPAPTWRSINDFQKSGTESLFTPPPAPTLTTPTMPAPPPVPTAARAQVTGYTAPAAPTLKSFQDFMPAWDSSPAFTWAMEQGNKDLDKRLSSMGLLGSGAELETRNDLRSKILADEVANIMAATKDTYQGYLDTQKAGYEGQVSGALKGMDAENAASQRLVDATNAFAQQGYDTASNYGLTKYGTEADVNKSVYAAQQNQASQLRDLLASLQTQDFNAYQAQALADQQTELTKDSQRLGAMDTVLNFLASINPMQYAFPATNTAAGNQIDLGKMLAQLMGSGGGGGGGSSGGGATLPAKPGGFDSTSYWTDTLKSAIPLITSAVSNFNK